MATIEQIVTSERETIIKRWLELARRVASARGLDEPALTNVMPLYLDALGRAEDGRGHVEAHFATRLRQGFQMAEIVDEFGLLGRCIVERTYALPVDRRPSIADLD